MGFFKDLFEWQATPIPPASPPRKPSTGKFSRIVLARIKARGISTLVAAIFFTFSSAAQAICLNPFGCEEKTQSNCRMSVAEKAKTEIGARVALGECMKLPVSTKAECAEAEAEWVKFMRSTDGAELAYPRFWMKEDCKKVSNSFFSETLWLTRTFCVKNRERLELMSQRNSARFVASPMGGAREGLEQLLGVSQSAVSFLYSTDLAALNALYAKGLWKGSKEELAKRLDIEMLDDAQSIKLACQKMR